MMRDMLSGYSNIISTTSATEFFSNLVITLDFRHNLFSTVDAYLS